MKAQVFRTSTTGFPWVWHSLWISSQLYSECLKHQDWLSQSWYLWYSGAQTYPVVTGKDTRTTPSTTLCCWSPQCALSAFALIQMESSSSFIPTLLLRAVQWGIIFMAVARGGNEKGCRGRAVFNSKMSKEEMLMLSSWAFETATQRNTISIQPRQTGWLC